MTDEATASKDNYIDLRLATISKDFLQNLKRLMQLINIDL